MISYCALSNGCVWRVCLCMSEVLHLNLQCKTVFLGLCYSKSNKDTQYQKDQV